MMKCKSVIKELEAYRKGELSLDFHNEIEVHLKTCADCRNELEQLRKLDSLMSNYRVAPVSAEFTANLQKKLADKDTQAKEYVYRFSINWRKAGLVASAAVVLIAALAWLINPFSGTAPIPATQEVEIAQNLDLLENLDNIQAIDYMKDYDLVEAFPEVLDVDLNRR